MPINFPVILELQKNNRTNFALKELRAAVEQVYQKFATYKLKDDLRRCLHCVTEQDNDRLHGRRLVELQPAELEKYGRKALTTWGDVDDFRHFLPRLLEFYPFIGTGLLPPEIVFGKLRYANWRNWPNEEQSALEDYFFALWRYAVVAIEPTPWTYCDDFLCAIAQADNDLAPYLEYWQKCESDVGYRNLGQFITQNCDSLGTGAAGKSSFWDERGRLWHQVVDWAWALKKQRYFADAASHDEQANDLFRQIDASLNECLPDRPVT